MSCVKMERPNSQYFEPCLKVTDTALWNSNNCREHRCVNHSEAKHTVSLDCSSESVDMRMLSIFVVSRCDDKL